MFDAEHLGRRLRYSERRKLAESGTLGPLTYEGVPSELHVAITQMLADAKTSVRAAFHSRLTSECIRHFGVGGQ